MCFLFVPGQINLFSIFITSLTIGARVSVWTRARVAIVIIVVTCASILA